MEYSRLFERAWRTVWTHKFLLILGIIIGAFSNPDSGFFRNAFFQERLQRQFPGLTIPGFESQTPSPGLPGHPFQLLFNLASRFGIGGWVALIVLVLLVLILIGIILLLARGMIIAGSAEADAAGSTSFGSAFRTAWNRLLRLILIASIPPIPITIAAIIIVIIATFVIRRAGGIAMLSTPGEIRQQLGLTLILISALIALPFALITSVLALLRGLADRACVTENRATIDSFRRGWHVAKENAGPVLILALFQLGIQIIAGAVLILPRFLAGFCLLLAPILWIVYGIMHTYFLSVWTLAWHEWTLAPAADQPPISEGL